MPPITENFVDLTTPLWQSQFTLLPQFQDKLFLSNRVHWGFSILFGQSGGAQVPLACNSAGRLNVSDSTLQSSLAAMLTLLGGTGALRLKDATAAQYAKVGSTGNQYTSIAEGTTYAGVLNANAGSTTTPGVAITNFYIKGVYDVLSDVHDPVNHYLKTHETA